MAKIRCSFETCKKKVTKYTPQCRCGGTYCSTHDFSTYHNCSYDYKKDHQELLVKNNSVIIGSKVIKI